MLKVLFFRLFFLFLKVIAVIHCTSINVGNHRRQIKKNGPNKAAEAEISRLLVWVHLQKHQEISTVFE